MSTRGKLLVRMAQKITELTDNDESDLLELTTLNPVTWTHQELESSVPVQDHPSAETDTLEVDSLSMFTEDGIELVRETPKKTDSRILVHQDVLLSSGVENLFKSARDKPERTYKEGFIKLDSSFSLEPKEGDDIKITFRQQDNLNLSPYDKRCENILFANYKDRKLQVNDKETISKSQEMSVSGINGKYNSLSVEPKNSEMEAEREEMLESVTTPAEIENLLEENTEEKYKESPDEDKGFTKKGEKRKRRVISESVELRREKKNDDIREKHKVKSPCSRDKCKKYCTNKVTEERRQEINTMYWQFNWTERKTFVLNSISRSGVKRRTLPSGAMESQRHNTFTYILKDSIGEKQEVCKIFFLTTLGYHNKNDWIIQGFVRQNAFKSTVAAPLKSQSDKRGKSAKKTKIPTETMEMHVESFNPTVSHYRREHAPNRRYLPSDLTVESMYRDYLKEYPQNPCSYELYRKVIKDKNISFTNLGHEECELCENFKLHNDQHNSENIDNDCDICKTWSKHKQRVEESRNLYRTDAQELDLANTIKVSVDLQKVIMLPRLEMFKKAIFTQRISVYNESFVPLGKLAKQKPFACLWHEGIAGRAKEEIISTFYAFFLHYRDIENFIIWVDNCSGQNKNWTFFSFLIYLVNSSEVAAKDICIKYFEPGHTFMSADSFHHQVELSLKKQKKTYDFHDFVSAVQKSNSKKVEINEMKAVDFYTWKNHTSQIKIKNMNPRPYLSNITQVTATRGNVSLKYKIGDDSVTTYVMDCLQNKVKKTGLKLPKQYDLPCGIPKEKKKNIIKNLQCVIPENRMHFWKCLDVKNE